MWCQYEKEKKILEVPNTKNAITKVQCSVSMNRYGKALSKLSVC